MNKAATTIDHLRRRVMWRKRWLSLQDAVALAAAIGGIITTGLILLACLRSTPVLPWFVFIGLALPLAVTLTRWFLARARENEAVFAIDDSLQLEDRMATAQMILERGGPARVLEEALLEDVAERVADQESASIVPFRMRRWYVFSVVSLLALAAAALIPPRSLPVAVAEARADIRTAGERLEQVAAEVGQTAPRETETAHLANEQAELGRAFRRSQASRAEALRRLSALEERIRTRHDVLKATRAEDIVNLAEQRLRAVVSTSAARASQSRISTKLAANDGLVSEPSQQTPKSRASRNNSPAEPVAARKGSAAVKDTGEPPLQKRAQEKQNPVKGEPRAARTVEAGEPQNRPQEPVSGPDKADPGGTGRATRAEKNGKRGNLPDDLKAEAGRLNAPEASLRKEREAQGDSRSTSSLDALKAVPNSVVEQAAKAFPKISEDLLKKAAELRSNRLSPSDIERLRQAAEALARNLEPIAQSQELRQALAEMSRKVSPEQIEQVARELQNQETLKQEFEAAARLLIENHQARETVAGLAAQFARMRDQIRDQSEDGEPQARDHAPGSRGPASQGRADSLNAPNIAEAANRRLAGRGREEKPGGKLQQRAGGEYLYLQSKAGAGAARAPYSPAYPQYRREAERAVKRSQVPPNLRLVVRKYFDAINPDTQR